ncbi:hypothetical protein KXD93_10140 [Mucilaginibacter sp. BJC16-A38]|uniref:hypothetical protein n=1 Tax=Mucilaginibacter phenanthrenivorans TaxID=1234842 RepID=UPI002157E13C|nr:hypothetical protein [Mucilaginibacter phenanthrenivorans]MCR8558004.1 hypothetical protein [Mucilaginibacter phenanthrenivorans]
MFTDIEQQTIDISWFFTDGNKIAFVASGGSKLPVSVAKSKGNLEKLFSYFDQLPGNKKIIINPDLKKTIKSNVDEWYLSSFTEMAEKGLFAYDRTDFSRFAASNYHLVASPVDPLKFNQLPFDVQHILAESKYNGELESLLDISLID